MRLDVCMDFMYLHERCKNGHMNKGENVDIPYEPFDEPCFGWSLGLVFGGI